jgi:hypothetical protein
LKIAQVGGKQQRILGQGAGGNLKIQRTDANFLPAQLQKDIRGCLVQRDDVPLGEKAE